MKSGIIILFCSVLVTGSCATTKDRRHEQQEVHASLLAYVPDHDRGPIQEARTRRAQVTEDLRIAESDRQQVESRLELAQHDLEIVEHRVEEAEKRVEHARRYGAQQELDEALRQVEESNNALRFAQGKIRYYEDLAGLAEDLVKLHEARVDLADATVELEEATAVARLDRPAAREVDVQHFRERVAQLQDSVATRDVEARASRMKVELRREFLDDRVRAVPAAFRLSEPEPAETVLTLPAPTDGLWGLPRNAQRGRGFEQEPYPTEPPLDEEPLDELPPPSDPPPSYPPRNL